MDGGLTSSHRVDFSRPFSLPFLLIGNLFLSHPLVRFSAAFVFFPGLCREIAFLFWLTTQLFSFSVGFFSRLRRVRRNGSSTTMLRCNFFPILFRRDLFFSSSYQRTLLMIGSPAFLKKSRRLFPFASVAGSHLEGEPWFSRNESHRRLPFFF